MEQPFTPPATGSLPPDPQVKIRFDPNNRDMVELSVPLSVLTSAQLGPLLSAVNLTPQLQQATASDQLREHFRAQQQATQILPASSQQEDETRTNTSSAIIQPEETPGARRQPYNDVAETQTVNDIGASVEKSPQPITPIIGQSQSKSSGLQSEVSASRESPEGDSFAEASRIASSSALAGSVAPIAELWERRSRNSAKEDAPSITKKSEPVVASSSRSTPSPTARRTLSPSSSSGLPIRGIRRNSGSVSDGTMRRRGTSSPLTFKMKESHDGENMRQNDAGVTRSRQQNRDGEEGSSSLSRPQKYVIPAVLEKRRSATPSHAVDSGRGVQSGTTGRTNVGGNRSRPQREANSVRGAREARKSAEEATALMQNPREERLVEDSRDLIGESTSDISRTVCTNETSIASRSNRSGQSTTTTEAEEFSRARVVISSEDPPLQTDGVTTHQQQRSIPASISTAPTYAPDPPLVVAPQSSVSPQTPSAVVRSSRYEYRDTQEAEREVAETEVEYVDPRAASYLQEMSVDGGADDDESGRAPSSLGDTYEPLSESADHEMHGSRATPQGSGPSRRANVHGTLSNESVPSSALERLQVSSARGIPSYDSFRGSITHSHLESVDDNAMMERGRPINFGDGSDDRSFPAMPDVGLSRGRKSRRSLSFPNSAMESVAKKSSPRNVHNADPKRALMRDREAVEKAWEGIEYQLQGSYATSVGLKHPSRAAALWRPLTQHGALKNMLCFGVNRRKDEARKARHSSRKARGPFLETKVQGSPEKVIEGVSRFARKEGYEVWRNGTEYKLRCKFKGNGSSVMWMSVEVDPASAGFSTVRVRRARADKSKTDWWKYARFHRDVIANFEEEAAFS